MKKMLQIFLLTILIGYPACTQTIPVWEWMNPKPNGIYLTSVQYISSTTWVFSGRFGYFGKTTNGGLTFYQNYNTGIYNTPGNSVSWNNDLHFFNENDGIMVGSLGTIQRTTNGGITWDTVSVNPVRGTTINLTSVFFRDNQNGYISGGSGTVLKTTDGGSTWIHLQNTGLTNTLTDIWSRDSLLVLATRSNNSTIIRSTDGGITWISITTGASGPFTTITGTDDVIFAGGENGQLRKSTDLGLTWTNSASGIPSSSDIYDIKVAGNTVIAIRDFRNISRSTNLGASWSSVPIVPSTFQLTLPLVKIAVSPSADTIVAVGSAGAVFSIKGTGSSPENHHAVLTHGSLYDSYISDNGRKIIITAAAGYNPAHNYYLSYDGGVNWEKRAVSPNSSLIITKLEMVDSSFGYAGTSTGAIFRTTDGGLNWDSIPAAGLPTPRTFSKIDFVSRDTGWVFCNNSTISNGYVFRTNDGGLSWLRQIQTGVQGNLPVHTGYMFNADSGFFYCSGGFYRTSNGGTDWVLTTPGSSINSLINDIRILPSGLGFGAGSEGKVIKTTDFGRTWSVYASPFTTSNMTSVEIEDENTAHCFGAFGAALYTTDGGAAWSSYVLGSGNNILGSSFYRDPLSGNTMLLVHGEIGTILRTGNLVVPVELISLSASAAGNSVILSWKTSTELNNSGFEIQRRAGSALWVTAGFIKGAGTTTIGAQYSFTDSGLPQGKYYYRLKQIDINGSFEYSHVIETEIGTPSEFHLFQNFPNPFNPETVISFSLESDGRAVVKIFDINGSEVTTLIDEQRSKGLHSIRLDASGLATGIYFYSLRAGESYSVRKMLLLK